MYRTTRKTTHLPRTDQTGHDLDQIDHDLHQIDHDLDHLDPNLPL